MNGEDLHAGVREHVSYLMSLKDGEPCKEPGCMQNIWHLCQGCGRVGGKRVLNENELIECIAVAIKEYHLDYHPTSADYRLMAKAALRIMWAGSDKTGAESDSNIEKVEHLSREGLIALVKSLQGTIMNHANHPPMVRCPFCYGSTQISSLKYQMNENLVQQFHKEITLEDYEAWWRARRKQPGEA